MPRVLFHDLSRHVGWAHDGPDGGVPPFCGTHHLPEVDGNNRDGWDYGPALEAYWRFVTGQIAVVQPDVFAYEAPVMPYGSNIVTREMTVRLLFSLAGLAECAARLAGVSVEEANIMSVKRHFTGHGHAKKRDVIARCRLLGWRVGDDNAADACAGWSMVKCNQDPRFSYQTTPIFATGRR